MANKTPIERNRGSAAGVCVMNTRELLEQAAKAHGLAVDRFNDVGDHIYTGTLGKWWSSLVVDGDCLRLAMALDINVMFDAHEQRTIAEWGDAERCVQYWNGLVTSKTEATRLAVTRAAAEIWTSRLEGAELSG
jgi:hypothetical protein